MKKVVAVAPYNHGVNFKMQAFDAWVKMGGETMPSHYPWRLFHRFAYNYELPTIQKNNDIAQLRFVEPASLSFDTFPDYARYEIIPLVWDCWPIYFEKTCRWFVKHDVKTAIFTSSQTAERMRERFPQMSILTITEGVNTSFFDKYYKRIKDRKIDFFEISSLKRSYFKKKYPNEYSELCNISPSRSFATDEDFRNVLFDTKVTIMFPRCDTRPEIARDIDTLTQRYWECMLAGIVMVGRAPKELVDFIGYDPVIKLDRNNEVANVINIIINANNFQYLVDKNRNVALKMADWSHRISIIMDFLQKCSYSC